MHARPLIHLLAVVIASAGCAPVQRGGVAPPLAPSAPTGWKWVPVPNIQAKLSGEYYDRAGRMAVRAEFAKTGAERRLLALETVPSGKSRDARALILECRLALQQGAAPRLAFVGFDWDDGAWYTLGRPLRPSKEFVEVRLPVSRLKQAAFSQDKDGRFNHDGMRRSWIGLVLDGAAQGVFEVRRVELTSAPYRPAQPLRVTGSGAGAWHPAQDPAVRSTLTTPAEGPDGKPCMKYEWTQPGGRHMYAIPHVSLPDEEAEGYQALRFTYKAILPKGIGHLFVALHEAGGAQYYTDELAPASAEWKTLTIPFARLKLGSWSKDDNGRLDLEQIASVSIGCHGTAADPLSKGTVWVAHIELVP